MLPIEAVERAVARCLRELDYFPTLHEILDRTEMGPDIEAAAAWQEFLVWLKKHGEKWTWVHRGGPDKGPDLPRPRIVAAAEACGGVERCYRVWARQDEALSFLKRDWMEEYKRAPAVQRFRDRQSRLSISGNPQRKEIDGGPG